MRSGCLVMLALAVMLWAAAPAAAQAPSSRVRGEPGAMRIDARPCPAAPAAEVRRRIVDIAAQEWAFFGFRILPQREPDDEEASEPRRRRRPRLSPEEAARVAPSIAGYWAVTPHGAWIVGRQNERWTGPDGIAARWNAPWSAAFISWVMCEAGLGSAAQFQRAIAHHTYIDQAIRARDNGSSEAAFVAYDAGEAAIEPGDLLCSSRRPAYRSLAERRRQMGVGARSHCDIVMAIDEAAGRILTIGGNVRGVVSLKVMPAIRQAGGPFRVDPDDDTRQIFAHLKLRAAPVAVNAFYMSPALTSRPGGMP